MLINFLDRIEVPTERIYTKSGQLIVPCAIARTGIQSYSGTDIGLKDSALVDVIREEDEVFNKDSIDSFRSVPVTIDHPTENGISIEVNSNNSKDLQVGVLEGLPVRDEDLLSGTVVIARQDAIDVIEGGTVELSVGYTCNIDKREGKYYQKDIRANHIAIVAKGRAGSSCSIADSKNNLKLKGNEMTELEIINKDLVIKNEDLKKIVDKKQAEVDEKQAEIDSKEKALEDSKRKIEEINNSFEGLIEERYQLISKAMKMTDKKDFKGMNSLVIKKFVIEDMLKVSTKDKSEAYINMRYDILSEDFDTLTEDSDKNKETPMSKLLNKSLKDIKEIKPEVNVVEQARQKMINRQTGVKEVKEVKEN